MPERSQTTFRNAAFPSRNQPAAGRDVLVRRPADRRPLAPPLPAPLPRPEPEAIVGSRPTLIDDFRMVTPQPFAVPAHPKLQPSKVLYRQAVRAPARAEADPEPVASPKSRPIVAARKGFRRPRPSKRLVVGVSLIVTGLFMAGLLFMHFRHSSPKAAVSQADVSETTPAPDSRPAEIKPTATAMGAYTVAADAPRQIIIPKLYTYSRVRSLGLNSQNQLQAPGNIFDTGWYQSSSKPGAVGSTAASSAILIDGHVNGPTQPGVFAAISKLTAGDPIQLVRGDGKVFHYLVVKTQSLATPPATINQLLISAVSGKPGLNLMTVHGPYDKNDSTNTTTTIVFAVQSDLTAN